MPQRRSTSRSSQKKNKAKPKVRVRQPGKKTRSSSVASRSSAGTARSGLSVALTPAMLRGQSANSTIAMPPANGAYLARARALYHELSGSTMQWELMLLETLLSPLRPYPLPGVGHHMFGMNGGIQKITEPIIVDPDQNPAASQQYPFLALDPGNWDPSTGYSGVSVTQYNDAGVALPLPPIVSDAYLSAKYDQRDGLCRGTFSVPSSGGFLVIFDPTEIGDPVRVIALKDFESPWINTTNRVDILSTGSGLTSQLDFSWDRDPYRAYPPALTDVGAVNSSQSDTSCLVYPGGATLHVAVQAKTAYSDVSMKCRSYERYDRRFFNAPTDNGEYGDPSQPTEAREGLAVYNGSTWKQRVSTDGSGGAQVVATRLAYAIQAGYPIVEVHVVNATAGGAPVNFNFEAKTWLGISYHTLRDNATTSFHTVPVEVPGWYTACAVRGAVSKSRSALGEELVANTVNHIAKIPKPGVIATTVRAVNQNHASGFKGVVQDVLSAVGVDPHDPIPSIMKFAGKKLLPVLEKALFA